MAVFFTLVHVAGIATPAFGLMFLVYWAAILRQDLSVFVPSVLGGITGIVLGWLLVAILPPLGTVGTVISLLWVATVLFCFMRGHVRLMVNNSLMLFLTMATIAELDVRRIGRVFCRLSGIMGREPTSSPPASLLFMGIIDALRNRIAPGPISR